MWNDLPGQVSDGVWTLLIDNVMKWDPEYFEDFWTVPGYLGFDPPESLARSRVQLKTTVTSLVMRDEAMTLGLPLPRLLNVPARRDGRGRPVQGLSATNLDGATLTVTSGAASGRVLSVVDVVDGVLVTGFGPDNSQGLTGVSTGDHVTLDNAIFLASQTFHRHQVDPDYPQWDQFRAGDRSVYPQRPKLIGPRYVRYGCGSVQTGRFAGKMIVVQNLMDEAAYPSQADFYRKMVQRVLGERLDDHYRLWFVDHAMHGHPTVAEGDARPVRTTRVVSYLGVLHQRGSWMWRTGWRRVWPLRPAPTTRWSTGRWWFRLRPRPAGASNRWCR